MAVLADRCCPTPPCFANCFGATFCLNGPPCNAFLPMFPDAVTNFMLVNFPVFLGTLNLVPGGNATGTVPISIVPGSMPCGFPMFFGAAILSNCGQSSFVSGTNLLPVNF